MARNGFDTPDPPLRVGAAGSGEGGGGDASSGDGGGDPEEGPIWLKLSLFLATVTSWSISDTLSAYVMRCAGEAESAGGGWTGRLWGGCGCTTY